MLTTRHARLAGIALFVLLGLWSLLHCRYLPWVNEDGRSRWGEPDS